jgi:hypothetical protein
MGRIDDAEEDHQRWEGSMMPQKIDDGEGSTTSEDGRCKRIVRAEAEDRRQGDGPWSTIELLFDCVENTLKVRICVQSLLYKCSDW